MSTSWSRQRKRAGAPGALATGCETDARLEVTRKNRSRLVFAPVGVLSLKTAGSRHSWSHHDASSHLYPMPQTVIIRSSLGRTRRSFVIATVTEEQELGCPALCAIAAPS